LYKEREDQKKQNNLEIILGLEGKERENKFRTKERFENQERKLKTLLLLLLF